MHEEGQPGNVVTPGASQPETSWQFSADSTLQSNEPESASNPEQPAQTPSPKQPIAAIKPTVSWTASEFIAHDKSSGWYLLLALGAAVLAVLVYLFTHGDKVSTAVVVIVAITFGILAARKPRELEYGVDGSGIHIGEKFYPYSGFRSFSIVQEEAVESIWFMPLKRFMPPLTLYFDPDDGEKIVDVLAQFLPLENQQVDMVDKLMHRLRF